MAPAYCPPVAPKTNKLSQAHQSRSAALSCLLHLQCWSKWYNRTRRPEARHSASLASLAVERSVHRLTAWIPSGDIRTPTAECAPSATGIKCPNSAGEHLEGSLQRKAWHPKRTHYSTVRVVLDLKEPGLLRNTENICFGRNSTSLTSSSDMKDAWSALPACC